MGRYLRHCGGGANPQPLRSSVDATVEKPGEADQPVGSPHIFLQKLHHVGTAGDVLGGRVITAGLSLQGEGGGEIARAFEHERVHRSTSLARTSAGRHILDGRDDVVVGAAAAQIAAHPRLDLLR